MKNVLANKEIINTFNLKEKPEFFETIYNNSNNYILSAVCFKKEIILNNILTEGVSDSFFEQPVIELFISDTQPNSNIESEGLYTLNVATINISHILTNFTDNLFDSEYSKLEITKLKLSIDGSLLFIGCTLYPKIISEKSSIKTYLLTYFINTDISRAISMDYPIIDEDPIVTELLEFNDIDNVHKVSSISCSNDGHVVSIILGTNIHISLRLKLIDINNSYDNDNGWRYEKELQNLSDISNTLGKRTLYSSVSGSGNRIALSNRDVKNKISNNSLAVTIGHIAFLVYNHNKKVWEVEDTYFERNLYIINLGEYVSINDAGDKLLTTAKYYDENNNIKNVIYVLAKNSKGKWTRFLREIIEEEITDVQLSSDGNKALIHTERTSSDGSVCKGLKFFFRVKSDMVHVNFVYENGNLIYNKDDKILAYISNSVTNINTLSSFMLVEDVSRDDEINKSILPKTYHVVRNNISFID